MSIIIKLNNHLEDTPISVPFEKPNAEKCVLRNIFYSEILVHILVQYSHIFIRIPGFSSPECIGHPFRSLQMKPVLQFKVYNS